MRIFCEIWSADEGTYFDARELSFFILTHNEPFFRIVIAIFQTKKHLNFAQSNTDRLSIESLILSGLQITNQQLVEQKTFYLGIDQKEKRKNYRNVHVNV